MSGTHFYLTLPSNASLNEFPNNKMTSYRVKLPQSIDLEGVWEVGLYSISYPNTWYTLQKGVDTHTSFMRIEPVCFSEPLWITVTTSPCRSLSKLRIERYPETLAITSS